MRQEFLAQRSKSSSVSLGRRPGFLSPLSGGSSKFLGFFLSFRRDGGRCVC